MFMLDLIYILSFYLIKFLDLDLESDLDSHSDPIRN